MSGRPNPQAYEQQLLQQQMMSAFSLRAQQAAYAQDLGIQRAQAQQRVQQQTMGMNNAVKKATRKPVTLATILTSPVGLLGNPTLSGTKLTG